MVKVVNRKTNKHGGIDESFVRSGWKRIKDYLSDRPKVMLRSISRNGETQTGYLDDYDRKNGFFTIEVASSGKNSVQFRKGDRVDVLGALLDEFQGEITEVISDSSGVDQYIVVKMIDDGAENSTTEVKLMKKLNITKEQFEKSRYFTKKYGKLEYVSESGNVFKTSKGRVLMFVKEGTESSPRFKCMEDAGVTTSTGGHYATFLTDMVAGFLEKQRGIDDVEHGDDGILVTFSDGGKVVVSFDTV